MKLAKIYEGALVKYPARLEDGDFPGKGVKDELGRESRIGIPSNITPEWLAGANLVEVVPVPRPGGDIVRPADPTFDGSNWVQTWDVRAFDADELAAFKDGQKARIDAQAERERQRYITAGEGQAMTYLEKANQAAQVAANPAIDPDQVPLVAARASVTGASLADAASEILTTRAQWLAVATMIEGKREAAKAAIDAAQDSAGVNVAASVDWSV